MYGSSYTVMSDLKQCLLLKFEAIITYARLLKQVHVQNFINIIKQSSDHTF